MGFIVQGNLQAYTAFSERGEFFNTGEKRDSTNFGVESCKILTVMI
jgi:hypothetical protein